ncbi:hypothetical protein LB526_11245 [Mesorhizobium sp. CA6]|uniref:hypothetical protein n=1 Tax=Mesorhizobium sp. CA6 TaxID=588500 RepID=UPI001CCA6F39|nr:hypothetical protein [Mesorhizobium sp. CA6]MBZ9767335.1 hypothetical protein [Mesorhizobium sp. CA6]
MDVFDSAVRTKGDLAGVFEYKEEDGPQSDTAYFYLYEPDGSIISAIHVRSGVWSITEADIAVKWDRDERHVGLFVFGVLTAAFDTETGARYGGRHGQDFNVEVPWS